MGFGMALGGVAKGIKSAEDTQFNQEQLALRRQGLTQDAKLREQALGIQQQRLEQDQRQQLATKVDKQIAESAKVVSDTVSGLREAGKTPEEIRSAISPLLDDIESLGRAAGADVSTIRQRVNLLVAGPTAMELATQKGGAAATQKLSEAAALEAGGVPRNMALTGAGVVRPVDPYTASLLQSHSFQAPATVPQIPETLKGTGAKWSPSRQRWYAPDGKSFNQQGVPIP